MPAPISVMIFSICGQEHKRESEENRVAVAVVPPPEMTPCLKNDKPPNVTVTLQKQMSIKGTFSGRTVSGFTVLLQEEA